MTVAGRVLPEGRYGARGRPASRRAVWVVGVCALVTGGLLAYLAYVNLGGAPIETERTGFANLPGNAMRLSFTVTRDQPQRPVVCVVRVRALDGAEGGRKEVLVPAGETVTAVETAVRSTKEPVTADVFGCSYDVPAYLSTMRPSG